MSIYELPERFHGAAGRGWALLEAHRPDPPAPPYWTVLDFEPILHSRGLTMEDIERAVESLNVRNPREEGDGISYAIIPGLVRAGRFVIPGRDDPDHETVINGVASSP